MNFVGIIVSRICSENGKYMEICRLICHMLHVLNVDHISLQAIRVRTHVIYIKEKTRVKHNKVLLLYTVRTFRDRGDRRGGGGEAEEAGRGGSEEVWGGEEQAGRGGGEEDGRSGEEEEGGDPRRDPTPRSGVPK